MYMSDEIQFTQYIHTTRRRRGMSWSQVARTVSLSISSHDFKSFWSKELWPPSSPDLNPMNFGIWSILEQKACSQSHSSVKALKWKLIKSWQEIEGETVSATCDQVIPRLRRVVRQKKWIYWVNCISSDIQDIKQYFISHFNCPCSFWIK